MNFKSYFKKILMLEAMMTDWDAAEIFGFTDGNIPSAGELRKIYLKKITAAHPDHGGDPEEASKLNAAYDILKKRAGTTVRRSGYSSNYNWNTWSNRSSSSSSSSQQSSSDSDMPLIIQKAYRMINDFCELYDDDLKKQIESQVAKIAKKLDEKTGYSWTPKYLVRDSFDKLCKNRTLIDVTWYRIDSSIRTVPIRVIIKFQNNSVDNNCEIEAGIKYVFDIKEYLANYSRVKLKPLFNMKCEYECSMSMRNHSRLLKKEYTFSGTTAYGSKLLGNLTGITTFFNTPKVAGFNTILKKYFSKQETTSASASAGDATFNSTRNSTSDSYSDSSYDSESLDTLSGAVSFLVSNIDVAKGKAFDNTLDAQFTKNLPNIAVELSRMTGYKWKSTYYIDDSLSALVQLGSKSEIAKYIMEPDEFRIPPYKYCFPVNTVVYLTNTEGKEFGKDDLKIETKYWFTISKNNIGKDYGGMGLRCFITGKVTYYVNGHKCFYKFRSADMINQQKPKKLINLENLTALLRLNNEGMEAKMRGSLNQYFSKKTDDSTTTTSSTTSSSTSSSTSTGSSYTKNTSKANASSTNSGSTKSGLSSEQEDWIIENLQKTNGPKFDKDFSSELTVKAQAIASELSKKTGYTYLSQVSVKEKLSDILRNGAVFDKCFNTGQGVVKVPLEFNASFVFKHTATKKSIKADVLFTFYLSAININKTMFGYVCDTKSTITLSEANVTYSFNIANNPTNNNFNVLNNYNEFFGNYANGAGKKVNFDKIIEEKYSKPKEEEKTSSTTGSTKTTDFRSYVDQVDIKNFVSQLNGYRVGSRKSGGASYVVYGLSIVAPSISSEEKKIIDRENFQNELLKMSKKLNSYRLIMDYNEKDKTVVFKRIENIILDRKYNEITAVSKEVTSKTIFVTASLLSKLKTFFSANANNKNLNSLVTKFNSLGL